MKHFMILAVAVTLAACKPNEPLKPAEPKSNTNAWKTYEDKVIRAQYPPSWKIDPIIKKGRYSVLTFPLDERGYIPHLGNIGLNSIPNTTDKTSLESLYRESVKSSPEPEKVFISKPKRFHVKGADCMYYTMKSLIVAECVTPDRKFYEISSLKAAGTEGNVKGMARFLQSLEFK